MSSSKREAKPEIANYLRMTVLLTILPYCCGASWAGNAGTDNKTAMRQVPLRLQLVDARERLFRLDAPERLAGS